MKSGAYASASEVMRAAVRALDREEAAIDGWRRQRVDEAFSDPRPNVAVEDVFKRVRKLHADDVSRSKRRRRTDAKG